MKLDVRYNNIVFKNINPDKNVSTNVNMIAPRKVTSQIRVSLYTVLLCELPNVCHSIFYM